MILHRPATVLMEYIVLYLQRLMAADQSQLELFRPVQLNLQTDYEVNFTQEDNLSTTIHIHPVNPILRNFRSYKLSCCTNEVRLTYPLPYHQPPSLILCAYACLQLRLI